MKTDNNGIRDEVLQACGFGRLSESHVGILGWGWAELFDENGLSKLVVPFANIVTTAGDQYYAKMGMALVGTPNQAQPTKVTGMKLGTGSTAVAKSGAGAALVTYTSGSNVAFNTSFPTAASKGGDTGWRIAYKGDWAAGVATATGLNEVVIVTDSGTNATSAAADTISRALLSPVVNKGASDTLAVTWNHDFLGA